MDLDQGRWARLETAPGTAGPHGFLDRLAVDHGRLAIDVPVLLRGAAGCELRRKEIRVDEIQWTARSCKTASWRAATLLHQGAMMYDHLGLHVKDLDASVRFYEAALAPLGYGLCSRDATSAGFGPPNEPALWLYADTAVTVAHVAFRAPSRAAVDDFHRRGTAAGGQEHGKPGLRADYAPTYYAAFLRDPDGNNVEAVCMVAP